MSFVQQITVPILSSPPIGSSPMFEKPAPFDVVGSLNQLSTHVNLATDNINSLKDQANTGFAILGQKTDEGFETMKIRLTDLDKVVREVQTTLSDGLAAARCQANDSKKTMEDGFDLLMEQINKRFDSTLIEYKYHGELMCCQTFNSLVTDTTPFRWPSGTDLTFPLLPLNRVALATLTLLSAKQVLVHLGVTSKHGKDAIIDLYKHLGLIPPKQVTSALVTPVEAPKRKSPRINKGSTSKTTPCPEVETENEGTA